MIVTGLTFPSTPYTWVNRVGEENVRMVKPVYVGWVGNQNRMDHSKYVLNLQETAAKYETAIPNWVGLKGLEQAMELYLELGIDDVHTYIMELTEYLYAEVAKLDHVSIRGDFAPENRSTIAYIDLPAEWAMNDAIMEEWGIRAHMSGTAVRVALHYFNNKADVDRLVYFLKNYQK